MLHAILCLKTAPGSMLEWHFWTNHLPSEGDAIILSLQSPHEPIERQLVECRIRGRVWSLDQSLSQCPEVMLDIVSNDAIPAGWTPVSERRFSTDRFLCSLP